MVLSWRRAFCTSIPKDPDRTSPIIKDKSDPSPRLRSRFGGFFSEPSTPRLHSEPLSSPTLRCRTAASAAAVPCTRTPADSPKLQCRTRKSPRFFHSSAPSSPRSPSTFSLLKSGLRISKVGVLMVSTVEFSFFLRFLSFANYGCVDFCKTLL